MTKAQENLIEKVRKALFEDPTIPTGVYIFPSGGNYASYVSRHDVIASYVSRHDVISALEELFNQED